VEGQEALFTADTGFGVCMDCPDTELSYGFEGRTALSSVFDDLKRYQATLHFNRQSTDTIDGDRTTDESYTIVHDVYAEAGNRQIMVASPSYLDVFSEIDQSRYLAERVLILNWNETRTLTKPAA
jgi:hypothetical protein